MKKLLVAAGVSAMLIASQAVAFADGAKSEDAPRVVDRVSMVVASPDEVVVPVKPGTPASVPATGTYNSLIAQATTTAEQQAYKEALSCFPYGCEDWSLPYWGPPVLAATVVALVVAANDDSESD